MYNYLILHRVTLNNTNYQALDTGITNNLNDLVSYTTTIHNYTYIVKDTILQKFVSMLCMYVDIQLSVVIY